MSTTETVDRTALRKAIREYIEATDRPIWSQITVDVATETGAKPTAIGRELDELEAHGFIYLVPSNDGRVVKLV